MYPNSVVNSRRRRLTRWIIGGNDENLVAGVAEVFNDSQNRIANTIDIGQK
jgi:hypothetical protein